MEQSLTKTEHQLQLTNRCKLRLTGVTEVISFDTQEILLETSEGQLCITGVNLHVKRFELERGEVEIDGKVKELTYKDVKRRSRSGLFGRMGQ